MKPAALVLRVVAPALIGAIGSAVLWFATDGLRAFTAESARRIDLVENLRAVPDVALRTEDGSAIAFGDLAGRAVVLDFIYTRCPTLCTDFGVTFRRLQTALAPEIAARKVVLLSVSFDREHDRPAQLRAYLDRFGAGRGWIAAAPVDEAALDRLLGELAVTVIGDGAGGLIHNDAVHVIDPRGTVAAVLDSRDVDGIRAAVARVL